MYKKSALLIVLGIAFITSVQPYFYKVNPFRAGILPNARYETTYIKEINTALSRSGTVLSKAAALANPAALNLLRKSELFAHIQETQKRKVGMPHKLLYTNVNARLGPFAHVTFPLTRTDAPKLISRITLYSHKYSIPRPMVYFVNAASFANIVPIGFGHSASALIVGRGALERLPEEEINRILSKELAHIYHRHDLKKMGAQIALISLLFGADLTAGNRLRDFVANGVLKLRDRAPAAYHLTTMGLRFPLVGGYKWLIDLNSSLLSDHFSDQAARTGSKHTPVDEHAERKQSHYLNRITQQDHSVVKDMIGKRFEKLDEEQADKLLAESEHLEKSRSFGVEGAGWFDTHLPLHEQTDQLEDQLGATVQQGSAAG